MRRRTRDITRGLLNLDPMKEGCLPFPDPPPKCEAGQETVNKKKRLDSLGLPIVLGLSMVS